MRQIGLAGILLITAGCAVTSSVALDRPTVVQEASATCPVFVMWPTPAPVSLRLMRLDNPVVEGRFRFTNRSRLTLNQPAARLLNDDFDAAVRALLGDQLKSGTLNPHP